MSDCLLFYYQRRFFWMKIWEQNLWGDKSGEQILLEANFLERKLWGASFEGENSFGSKFVGEEIWGARIFGGIFALHIKILKKKILLP